MIDVGTFAIIAALLAANGLFVAAEFAIVGAPRTAIDQLAAQGNLSAARVSKILRDPLRQDRYIATAQLGITIASLGLGMYAEPALATAIAELLGNAGAPAWLLGHAIAGTVALIALTYLHIVLGEMVPKALSLARPERAALWLTPIMLAVQAATYPLVIGLNGIGNALLRVFGIERRFGGGAQFYTAEELQYIVRESERRGMLHSEAAHVVDELIDFGRLSAREAMVPRVKIHGVEVGAGLGELGQVLTEAPHARYPVFAHDLDHIVGMVHVKDIAARVQAGTGIRQDDIRPIPFVPGSATLDRVLGAMRDARVQMAVVMDEHGGTDGLITTEDLFEEVIGEIEDAGSDEPSLLHRARDGSLHAAGLVRLDELGDYLERALEREDIDTVSGLVLALLDRPPHIGDRVRYAGLELEVLQVEGHGVTECRVTLIPDAELGPAPPAP